MQKVFVRLSPEARAALIRLAEEERRRPADQAALIIEHALAKQTDKTKEASMTA
jgi:hypothetical protein